MPEISFDRYYRYEDLTSLLKAYAEEYPSLVKVTSIGQSYEGREIWMATVTDFTTGPDSDKPAFWCDGNIHASEVSASTAVLKILDQLVSQQPAVLQTRAFYLVPRLNPDGAEWALADIPKIIRSSTRPYPYDEEDPYGLEQQDVNGDGMILSMRIEDPNGPWKISPEEPRLLTLRQPGDEEGPFYRVLPEGLLHNFDGDLIRRRRTKEGLDLNRNFPSGWRPESEQYGAGEYPTSEPEIRAAVQAITERKNICGAVTYHTFSGVILRPPGRHSDDEMAPEDLWTYDVFGKKGTAMSGYPQISVFHDFKYHPKEMITGVFDDWVYDHLGCFAWTVEIWSPQRQAGITDYKYIDWFRSHPHSDDLKLLKWSDEALEGKGYHDWQPFDHPQLGRVEIGGWNSIFAFRNPPPAFLHQEVTPLADWAIWLAGATPCLRLREVKQEDLGDVMKIKVIVENSGYLPTQVSERARSKGLARGVVSEISLRGVTAPSLGQDAPDWLVSGKLRETHGQLKGWNGVPVGGFGYWLDSTDDRLVCEWVVKKGGTYEITVRHDRAGIVRVTIDAS
ncbi:MAG: M14 family metallopeptidase [Fimbriimonadaceae bacterium]|jgi:murein tripeptide amidase MpaA|nr:M14 family metallopeptidase [Fimbriimonadaceae bacterium]